MQDSLKTQILNKAFELLKKYPLCDNCLGRCFARLSLGHTNEERGKAIKLLLLMEIDRLIKEHEIEDISQLKEILYNIGPLAITLYQNYFSDSFQNRVCYLCENKINEYKEKFEKKALEKLQKDKTFVLGVKLSEELKKREEKFVIENQLLYYESLKNEIKREVGKNLLKKGFTPDFDNPQVEIIYDIENDAVIELTRTTKYLAFYNRLARGIPISSWASRTGESLESILGIKIVAPYSEFVEFRVIDDYPLIVENITEKELHVKDFHIFVASKVAGKELSTIYTIRPTKRLYRVTIYSEQEIKDGIRIYDNLYDIFVEAKDFKELLSKLSGLTVISVDVISTYGKSELLADTYIKSSSTKI